MSIRDGSSSASSVETSCWRFSAPGKTILFGEHAVVYGKKAVAGSIGLRTMGELKIRSHTGNILDEQVELHLPDLNFCRNFSRRKLYETAIKLERLCRLESDFEPNDLLPPMPHVAVPLARELCEPFPQQDSGITSKNVKYSSTPIYLAILTFVYVLLGAMIRNREIPSFKLTISSKIPIRVGLGSSGAYCVTLCAALLRLANVIDCPAIKVEDGYVWSDDDLCTIERWGKAAEALIHGKTSGLDVVVCSRGGLISYKPGEPPETIICAADLRIIIVNTKVERNTQYMVSLIKQNVEKFPEVMNKIFDAIDEISHEAARLLSILPAKSGSSSPVRSVKKSISPVLLSSRVNGYTNEFESASPSLTPNENGINDCNTLTNCMDSLKMAGAENEYSDLQELCRINNYLLNALGVGHAKISHICSLMARYGIHTKLSGAGGGGTVFAFITKEASQTLVQMIKKELCQQGFELWQPNLGGTGIVQHM